MLERNEKREQFNTQPSSGKKVFLSVVILAIAIAVVAGWSMFGAQVAGGPEIVTAAQDGQIRLSASDFSDGKARFYRFQGKSGPVDFFVVQSKDGVIRSAFDTCDVCYKALKGYRQEGDEMVCNNCDQKFRTDKINVVKGGCNPAPLKRQQTGETLVIAASDIETGAWYFKGAVN